MKAKQPWDIENPEYKLHIRKIHDILTDEVEAFDAIIPNARKKLEFPLEPCIAMRHNKCTSPPPRHRRRRLQCQTEAVSSQHGAKGDSLTTERVRQIKAFESQRYPPQKSEITRFKITLLIDDISFEFHQR